MIRAGEHKSKLLKICFADGTLIGEININGANGTYLQRFKLYEGYSQNPEINKICILRQGIDYTGFNQEKYLETIQKGLSKAFGCEIEFREKVSKLRQKKLMRKLMKN